MGVPVNMSSAVSVLVHVTNPHPHSVQFANDITLNITENSPPNSSISFMETERELTNWTSPMTCTSLLLVVTR